MCCILKILYTYVNYNMIVFLLKDSWFNDRVQGHNERSKVIFTGNFELATAISSKVFVVSSWK